MTTIITLSKKRIDLIDLSIFTHYVEWHTKSSQYFFKNSGEEMYKLLAYLSCQVTHKNIIDIGTLNGFSALALSSKDDTFVISYDVQDVIPDDQMTIKNKGNIEMRCMDCLEDIDGKLLASTDLICIDIDHKGCYEREIMKLLERHHYKGLVVVDNIFISPAMKTFWDSITLPKYVVTPVGHWTGTGIVVFDASRYSIVLQ